MTKNINLPIILEFSTGASAAMFCEEAEKIIPKLKFESMEDNKFIFFTRKDKNYRDMVGDSETEETSTITEVTEEVIVTNG